MKEYEKVPTDILILFYIYLNKNIEKGLLTEKMYEELKLIRRVLSKRVHLYYLEKTAEK